MDRAVSPGRGPGPALAEGVGPGPGPCGRGHLPPGGGGRGEIRQEHHDQRPGGPGPVAPGRRDPHGHGHPGSTRPGIPGGAPVQGVGRNQRGNPPGLGAFAQSPAGGPGRAPGPTGAPGPGTPGPGPGRGPGGRPLDRRQPGSELPAAEILPGGLRSSSGPHARHRDAAPDRSGPGPPPGPGHPGGHRGVPQGRPAHHPLSLAGRRASNWETARGAIRPSPSTWPRSWPISSRAIWRSTSSAPGWGCARRISSFWRS